MAGMHLTIDWIMFFTRKYESWVILFSLTQLCSIQHLYLDLMRTLACRNVSTITRVSVAAPVINMMFFELSMLNVGFPSSDVCPLSLFFTDPALFLVYVRGFISSSYCLFYLVMVFLDYCFAVPSRLSSGFFNFFKYSLVSYLTDNCVFSAPTLMLS